MFATEVGGAGEQVQRPFLRQAAGHGFPEIAEPVVQLPWTCEPLDVGLDEFDPVVDQVRRALAEAFPMKSKHCHLERFRIEPSHPRRAGRDERLLVWRFLVADPAEIPVASRNRMECVQHVGQQETGGSAADLLPSTVCEHPSFASETGQQKGSCLVFSDNTVGVDGMMHAKVGDLVAGKRRADWCSCEESPAILIVDPDSPKFVRRPYDMGLFQLVEADGHECFREYRRDDGDAMEKIAACTSEGIRF